MAKDPAFLFYPNDWIGGTMGMTFEQKGAYMELLMMQFNRGHMSTHMITQVVGHMWDHIKDKFVQDEDGKWYNERLEQEKKAREKFTKSRRDNLSGENNSKNNKKKTSSHMDPHMDSHMEDEDVNKDVNKDIVYPFDSEIFKKWWKIWKEYKKKEHRFSYKSHISEQAALKKLSQLSRGSESTAIQIIEEAISNGWQGLFPLDDTKNKSTQNSYENLKRKFQEESAG
jgi:uncharacterized protein YdaU (DUF1376 family)